MREDLPVVRRSLVEEDRTTGPKSLSVEKVGDFYLFWTTTGLIADGGSKVVYLTGNAGPGGEKLFTKAPNVTVEVDEVGSEPIPSAHRPVGPAYRHKMSPVTTWVREWLSANEVWTVTVTNSTGSTKDFSVQAQGV